MVTGDGRVKVLDFGLAKLTQPPALEPKRPHSPLTMGSETMEGRILALPPYMSPEQAEGKPVEAHSRYFSFGAVLYEMIAGRPAFRRDTHLATLSAVLRGRTQATRAGAEGRLRPNWSGSSCAA